MVRDGCKCYCYCSTDYPAGASRIADNKFQEGYCIPSDLVESSGVRYTTSWRRFLDDSGRAYACFGATSESSLIPTLPLQLAHGNNSSTWLSVEQGSCFETPVLPWTAGVSMMRACPSKSHLVRETLPPVQPLPIAEVVTDVGQQALF